ncbi:MAG: Rho termination factor N-terminal domain-containing protein, partial [Cyanobacteria bacterium KgW148]|nr:Rho termination factor N-terminal domain-containing protein [Cyanobacteria bacterium KgW148]
MIEYTDIGTLKHLYLDEIEIIDGTDAPSFLIEAAAQLLKKAGGRNWLPVVVKEISKDRYQVIGNAFVYAVAEKAGLERIWCIIADGTEDVSALSRVLAREETPKLNLSTASREEIKSALQFLIEQPNSPLKTVKLATATERIDEAPRQSWKSLDAIVGLKCGITKGKKLDLLKTVFYLTPQSPPIVENGAFSEETLKLKTVSELKELAKEKGIAGLSKMKKA